MKPDDHLVVHDLATGSIAVASGVAIAALTDSVAAGGLGIGVIAVSGLMAMKTPPVRRAVNGTINKLRGAK